MHILKYFLLFFVVVLSIFSCDKKNNLNNSLNQFSKSDSLLFEKKIDSLRKNYTTNNDSLISYSENIISLFNSNKAVLNEKIAYFHFNQSNYFLAEYFFTEASNIYLSDSLLENYADQLGNIGVTEELLGNYKNSIEYYLKALNIFDSLNLELKNSKIYNNIGIVYQQLNEPNTALNYFRKSLIITEKLDKHEISANRYNNIATIFEEHLNNLDSAIFYYNKSLKIYKTDSSNINLPTILNNIGYVYLKKGNLTQADSLFNSALNLCVSQNRKSNTASILRNKANLEILYKNYDNAIKITKEAITISQTNLNTEIELECLKVLHSAYDKQNDFKNANNILKNYYELKDNISGEKQKTEVNRLNIQYEVKEKEQKIKILELKNNVQHKKLWQLWLSISILTVLLVGLFIFYKLQQKNSELELQQMRTDIQDYIIQIEEINNKKLETNKKTEETIFQQIKKFELSEREEEVLVLISKGFKNIEIADKLFISLNTVKTHTKNIFSKLDVRNRIEAIRKTQFLQ